MTSYGDITSLKGADIAPVDVIIGGSPCQDLSVAGLRKGLDGERSKLFCEQIRIIKEMHNTYGRTKPRFMVWENVPGALSSNKSEDFRTVLEETAKIADPKAFIPRPPHGKWTSAGIIVGDGWSVAWRIHDAQFWGVPQRRRRIALVADFGGECAGKILFERESMSGDFKAGDTKGQEASETSSNRAGTAIGFKYKQGANTRSLACYMEQAPTLDADGAHPPAICYAICSDASNSMKSDNPNSGIYIADTSRTIDKNGGSPCCSQGGIMILQPTDNVKCLTPWDCQSKRIYDSDGAIPTLQGGVGGGVGNPAIFDSRGNGDGNIAPTLVGDHQSHISDYTAIICESGRDWAENISTTLKAKDGSSCPPCVVAVDLRNINECDVNGTLQAKTNGGYSINYNIVVRVNKFVRRPTPTECERLQGFPDGWTDIGEWRDGRGKIRKPADSNRYKALGNSIALPFWQWLTGKIAGQYDHPPTLGSLFDGIGGFQLVWQRVNGENTCLWTSEIDGFCRAVTDVRFKGADPTT